MLINDIKDIVKDFKLTNSQLIWISSFLIVIIIGLGSYAFFKKDNSPDKDIKYNNLLNNYNSLVIQLNNLENDFNNEVDKVNTLSSNTDKRFIYVIKKLETKKDVKDDMIDVINLTKTEQLKDIRDRVLVLRRFL